MQNMRLEYSTVNGHIHRSQLGVTSLLSIGKTGLKRYDPFKRGLVYFEISCCKGGK